MQQSAQFIVVSRFIQLCGTPSSETASTNSDDGYFVSCEDYQLMLDVEMTIGQECTMNSQCNQILIEGDLHCESNSLLVNTSYVSEHFYSLYDEAILQGDTIDIPFNEDCSATQNRCIQGRCSWN